MRLFFPTPGEKVVLTDGCLSPSSVTKNTNSKEAGKVWELAGKGLTVRLDKDDL